MSIKSILVVMSGTAGEEARLQAAFDLATRHDADVAVLHVRPTPAIYGSSSGFEIPISLIESQQREIEETAETVEAAVKTAADRAAIEVEWRCEEGDELAIAGVHARYADLVIAPPALARDLVFASASPVLSFPDGAKTSAPKRVLIAWNGSREAARAVRDAMALIEAAESVDVIVIDPPGDRPISADIGRALAHHDIKVDVRERLSGDADIGTLLLEEARTSGADLLVMGAFGHSRLREWVLGGATEGALKDSKMPIVLSH